MRRARPGGVMVIMLTAVALTMGLPIAGHAATVSGVYVGASADAVRMLQIVRTQDGRVEGRIEEVTISKDAAIQDNSMAMDGAVDGQQITLAPKSGLIATFGGSMTGLVDGDVLDLSWQGGHSVLKRSDAYGFEVAVNALHVRSARMLADLAARNQAVAKVAAAQSLRQDAQRLDDQLDAFGTWSTAVIAQLETAQTSYADLGRAAQRQRSKQGLFESIQGGGVAAMNAGTTAQGALVKMDGIHGDVNGLRVRASGAIAEIRQTASSIELACRADPVSDGQTDPCRDIMDEKDRLSAIVGPLSAAFDSTDRAFAQAETQANTRRHLIRDLLQGQ